MNFTTLDKLAAVERELELRHRVYARRVAEGKMSAQLMLRQIAIFDAIAADYRVQAESERLI